ncbi:MAG: hypothetical protein HY781_09720 [Chloroflexi bacterium]|nr:hypothetical protein [Chloroflexota bacterium]
MNVIAEKYSSNDVGAYFLYTHEAHPGEHMPHLTSLEQKFSHAAKLRDILGVTRPILVDALDGACHRAFGSMPNMTWIFNRSGLILYKSDWTDAHSVENALIYFLEVLQRRQAGERLAPFHVERMDYRNQDRQKFYQGLERNGPKAVTEFRNAFPDG